MSTTLPAGSVDLDAIRTRLGLDRPGSRLNPIGLRHLLIGDRALDDLPAITDAVRRPGEVVVLMDSTPMRHGEVSLKPEVVELLAPGREVRAVTLGEPDSELHVDAGTIAAATAAVEGAGCMVALGSGSICDIAKEATRPDIVPLVVVQTANSVNAFSDDMAVILRDGVKRTVPSRWPDALVIDLSVIADAPARLNRSGIGELAAVLTAPADWYLAGAIGMDGSYDRRVVDLFREGADELAAIATGVERGDLDAIESACDLMTRSGLALGVAGRTAPMSGTEHTVSHLLDMSAETRGKPTGLHGAQVGVAAVVVATAWDRLLDELDPERLLAAVGEPDGLQRRVSEAFAGLDPSGRMVDECWREVRQKADRFARLGPRLEQFTAEWDEHRLELRRLLGSPADIRQVLVAAGGPSTFAELDPGVDGQTARWALWNGHLQRSRFSMADLAWFAGSWSEDVVAQAVEAASAA
jgi:glycerol-1-phosphate dehydrogenase [NAD(P)+]